MSITQTVNGVKETVVQPLPTPITGKADWREFRCFQLSNGVTMCLVRDKESKTTAAAATVNVGAAADPRDMSGLAHFCEHMCFLGSEKYPGENEYKSYLAQHGGRSNASTSMHLTTYKFEILADYAEHALDIFSNFFVAPLFTKSGTNREVNAVDSENSKNLTEDVRRRLQILKDLGDQSHYYTKFSTGNAKTLPTDTPENLERVRDALLTFHRKHYRPDNLTVVVAGPQSLDQLESWVVPKFASMRASLFPLANPMTATEIAVDKAANDAPQYHFSAEPQEFQSAFRPELQTRWPALLTVKPVRSMRRLVLMFALPPVFKVPDRSPSSVLSHLLGHEGSNSPFAVLQNEGLVSSLSAGPRVSAPDFTLFQVDIGLTDAGEKRWKDVADVIFQHCRLIAESTKTKSGIDELRRIWGEKAALNAMFFNESSPGSVYTLAPSLSNSIVAYGTEISMAAGSMLKESDDTFPLEQVKDFASRMVPSNCLIERCSEAAWDEMEEFIETDSIHKKQEQWYGIDYFESKIEEEVIKRWEGKSNPSLDARSQLKLPRKNCYIPRTLEICSDLPEEAKQGPRIDKEIEPPKLIVEDEKLGRLWHRLDDRYALPKSSMSLLIRSAAVENSKVDDVWRYDAKTSIHSTLLSTMFTEALAQETYDAELAGLHWGLSISASGIKIACNGFSDRLPDLSSKVIHEFLSGNFIQESYFLSAKDRILRNLRTYFESRRADSHSIYYRDFLLAAADQGLDAAIKAVEDASLELIRAHHMKLLENEESQIECLFSGNVSESEAKSFFTRSSQDIVDASKISGLAKSPDAWVPGSQERRLAPATDIELHFASKNDQEENGSVVVTYQSPIPGFRGEGLSSPDSLRSSAALRLLCRILREPLYDELRTKQTLGYIVSSYFDVGYSSTPSDIASLDPWTVPVDFVVISVLSRKVAPPEVLRRIDDFLSSFRESLLKMPESEIADFANALSTQMLKPIQKLSDEVSIQFSKIRHHAPQVLKTGRKMPWDNSKAMAAMVRSLKREDLLKIWDSMMLPNTRSRVASCVYGTTFPLKRDQLFTSSRSKIVIVDSLTEIIELRKQLPTYDNKESLAPNRFVLRLFGALSHRSLGVGALVGAGVVAAAAGWTIMGRSKKLSSK